MTNRWIVLVAALTAATAFGAVPPQPGDKETGKLGILFDQSKGGADVGSMRFGLHLLDASGRTTGKRLTYDARGLTSNTCVRLDGKEYLIGHAPGQWRKEAEDLGAGRGGVRSVWSYPEGVIVTQTVEIVRGEQTGALDTCRIEYVLENEGKQARQVGIRFLLDTMIGANDGTPFFVPGAAGPVDTSADYKLADQVPAFAQALENLDFRNPGVVATIRFKAGGDLEAPGRVTLGGWPDKRSKQPGANDGLTLYSVPVFSMQTLKDAGAVLYWAEKKLEPKQQRRVGFTYGLGNFVGDNKGILGMIVDGRQVAGQELTVVALMKAPKAGETLTLHLSDKLDLVKGAKDTAVKGPIGQATWTVRPTEAGVHYLGVESKSGELLGRKVIVTKKPATP
jgi:hypothetical protein